MAKSKLNSSNNSKISFKIIPLFALSFLVLITLVLAIFFIKQIYQLSQGISAFKPGQETNFKNISLYEKIKVNNNSFREEKFYAIPESQQNFNELSFVASPDGSKFSYIIKENNIDALYVNGENIAQAEKISFVKFSPDGQRLAYGTKINNKNQVIIDGKAGQIYDWIFEPYFFTPDNRYFIYKARKDEGDIIVFNNTESRPYDKIYSVFLTDDKKQVVFYARTGAELWKTTVNLEDLSSN